MILSLIKKDFLLVKKYIILAGIIGLIAPPLLFLNMDDDPLWSGVYQIIIYMFTMLVLVVFITNSVSLEEEKSQKGCAYLLTTPYSRNDMVVSKYIFLYIICILYTLIYSAAHILFPQLTTAMTRYTIVYSSAFVITLKLILMPIEFKFGYEKAKYIIMILTIGFPFLFSAVSRKIGFTSIDLTAVFTMKTFLGVIVFIMAMSISSFAISCYIFGRKEL